ncbi:MAG: tetratricopeptide repeat protein [Selenomonadaceae bacterium]|nr:tetratricopeptide repeat protein [Selenomonadaceae bacterium]
MMSFVPSVVDVPIISGISVAHAQEDDAYSKKRNEWYNLDLNKKYNEALVISNELIQNYPDKWDAYRTRSITYKNMHQYDKALEDINKAIELAPDEPTLYWDKTFIYEAMHQPNKVRECKEELIKVYTRLIQQNSNKQSYYFDRAFAYQSLEDYKSAAADYTKGLSLPYEFENDNNVDKNEYLGSYYFVGGFCYQNIKDYANAIEMLSKAIEFEPNRWHSYLLRGQCYEAIGEKDKAKADYVEAEIRKHGGQ